MSVDSKNGSDPLAIELDAKALNLIRQRRPQTSISQWCKIFLDEKVGERRSGAGGLQMKIRGSA